MRDKKRLYHVLVVKTEAGAPYHDRFVRAASRRNARRIVERTLARGERVVRIVEW